MVSNSGSNLEKILMPKNQQRTVGSFMKSGGSLRGFKHLELAGSLILICSKYLKLTVFFLKIKEPPITGTPMICKKPPSPTSTLGRWKSIVP